MAEIFISYASEDRDLVAPLVEALQAEGWTVWWDRDLVAGPSFDDEIEAALEAARCVVIAWSRHAIRKRWCRAEANEGLERDILVPVCLEDVRPPLAFRTLQTASLAGWPEQRAGLEALLSAVRHCLARHGDVSAGNPKPADGQIIAVLPLANLSADPEQEYFCDGLTEDLIDRLVRETDLKVIARTSSFEFKNRNIDVRQIARQLDATHLIEGSVRRAGDKVRVTVQLVRADDATHLWSERYDRTYQDVFALQDEIVEQVALALRGILPARTHVRQPPPQAYEAYLRGRTYLSGNTTEEVQLAQKQFEAALALDADYADALAGIADTLTSGLWREPIDYRRAEACTEQALRIDPGHPGALGCRARIQAFLHWRLQDALETVHEALRLSPNDPRVLQHASVLYQSVGRQDLALDAARRQLELDPLSSVAQFRLGGAYVNVDDFPAANDILTRALEVHPDNALVLSMHANLKARLGDLDGARQILRRRGFRPDLPAAFAMALLGETDMLRRMAHEYGSSHMRQAICHALLAEEPEFQATLQQAVASHDPMLQLYNVLANPAGDRRDVHGRPLSDLLRSEGAQAIMRQIGWDWETVSAWYLDPLP